MKKRFLLLVICLFLAAPAFGYDENVAMLQRVLQGMGYYSGVIDGIYGPNTSAGVAGLQSFLQKQGYYYGAIDGVFGPVTFSAMQQYAASQQSPPKPNYSTPPRSGYTPAPSPPRTSYTPTRQTQKDDAMTDEILFAWVLFLISELFVLNAFFEQRAALDIGRKIGQDIRHLVLPSWYPWTNLARILSWGALIYIFVVWIWYYPIIAAALSFIITIIFPVPESKYANVNEKLKSIGMR